MGSKTIYEEALSRGVSRRDFLKMCTALTATMGLDFSMNQKVIHAMETAPRVPVIWMEFQGCSGCTESFIRTTHPKLESILFDMVSLEYTEVLSAASGMQVEEARQNVLKNNFGEYVLVTEGSIPESYQFLSIGGHSGRELFEEAAKGAKAIITYGSCASWGGLPAAYPNPTKAHAVSDFVSGKPVIRVPGCPPIAEVMTGVIAHIITFGEIPELDSSNRPKAFYRHRIHDKCNRRAYFDAGLFAESFDDEGARQGYCLYKLGCKGPTTYNACAEVRWNGGTSFPILSGNPCIGCSEENFWDNGPFYVRRANIPGTQTTTNPDSVGVAAAAVTAAGVAIHAAATVVAKNRKDKKENEAKK